MNFSDFSEKYKESAPYNLVPRITFKLRNQNYDSVVSTDEQYLSGENAEFEKFLSKNKNLFLEEVTLAVGDTKTLDWRGEMDTCDISFQNCNWELDGKEKKRFIDQRKLFLYSSKCFEGRFYEYKNGFIKTCLDSDIMRLDDKVFDLNCQHSVLKLKSHEDEVCSQANIFEHERRLALLKRVNLPLVKVAADEIKEENRKKSVYESFVPPLYIYSI